MSSTSKLTPLALTALSLFLTGCGGNNYDNVQPLRTDAPPPLPAAAEYQPYRIQVGDVLDIKFRLNPELNETATVRPDGMISTAVAPDVSVSNQTVAEVNNSLAIFYKKELRNPQLSVIVRSFAPARIYVSGEVNNPGEFVVIGPTLTLTQAIARAGGIRNSADWENVLVIRRGAGEKGEIYRADYKGATQDADPTKDARLAPYDVVYVPKTGAALAYKGYEQNFQQFVQPSVSLGASYELNPNRR